MSPGMNLRIPFVLVCFAALFIAQAYGFDLSFGQQLTLLLVMMAFAFYNDLSKHAAGFIEWVKDL